MLDDQEARRQAARVEALLEQVESSPDPVLRARVGEIVEGLLALYGTGLARMVRILGREADAATGVRVLDGFAADELVTYLLLLHGLHPVDLESRVSQALEQLRPFLATHGGDVEFIGIEAGRARVRLQGNCRGCPSSAATLRHAVESAVREAAPELAGVDAEEPDATPSAGSFVPVAALSAGGKPGA